MSACVWAEGVTGGALEIAIDIPEEMIDRSVQNVHEVAFVTYIAEQSFTVPPTP